MDWQTLLIEHWQVKLVSVVLIWAAWIDGKQLKVPNAITFPMILSGLLYNTFANGLSGLGFGLAGMATGLALLLVLYAIGGMGAGDVKLLAGVGAWLGWEVTLYAYLASAVVGGVMALIMVARRKSWEKFMGNISMLLHELQTVKNPVEISKNAAIRKPQMHLLPYGIPICIGSIIYFCYAGIM